MRLTRAEVAKLIRNFVEGSGGAWDWDDFISTRLDDPQLDEVRSLCAAIPDAYPPTKADLYCSEGGLDELRKLADSLEPEAREPGGKRPT